jgi:hypothetical protein
MVALLDDNPEIGYWLRGVDEFQEQLLNALQGGMAANTTLQVSYKLRQVDETVRTCLARTLV